MIDDPNSYYDSDEYDSDGKIIRKDEIKRQQLEEERLQRKLKRKPNTPHLVKKYMPVPMNSGPSLRTHSQRWNTSDANPAQGSDY